MQERQDKPNRETLADRRVLVTGATGFIGSHLVERLVREAAHVRCLVRPTSNCEHLNDAEVERVDGDLRDPDALDRSLEGIEIIFHLAGVTAATTRHGYFAGNCRTTANVVRACLGRAKSIRRLVYTSSIAAAGPSRDGSPLDENAVPCPVSLYGKSKLRAERIVLAVRDRIDVTVIRPSLVYGPRDRDLFKFFKLIARGVLPQVGHRRRYVSLIAVADLVDGLLRAAVRPKARGETYFLANRQAYDRTEVAAAIARGLGVPCPKPRALPEGAFYAVAWMTEMLQPLLRDPSILSRDRVAEAVQDYWTCSPRKAEHQIGFRPRIALSEGIRHTADWYRTQGWL